MAQTQDASDRESLLNDVAEELRRTEEEDDSLRELLAGTEEREQLEQLRRQPKERTSERYNINTIGLEDNPFSDEN